MINSLAEFFNSLIDILNELGVEVLPIFLSKISPKKRLNKLSDSKIKLLIFNIKKVLIKAIKEGGSSIKDFNNIKGKRGNFQQFFNVYGRKNQKCSNTGCEGIIKKIVISNRSTFYCPVCQKY